MISTFAKQMVFRSSTILLIKGMGFLARISLFRLLGPEGIGLYQMAYSVFGMMLTVTTGGLPTAIAQSTAKNRKKGWLLFRQAAVILACLGVASSFVCFHFAPQISLLLGDSQLEFPLRCVAPAIAVVPLLSLLRGFLQGYEILAPIAFSEFIEQGIRIVTMLVFASLWLKYGQTFAVGGAVLGAFTGSMLALCFLALFLLITFKQGKPSIPPLITPWSAWEPGFWLLFRTSLTITTTRLIVPISEFLDALIIPHRLQDAGLSVSEATAVYGQITGMAATIVYMPTLVTSALSFTIFANMTKEWLSKEKQRFVLRTGRALTFAWIWGLGSGLFLFLFAHECSSFLFADLSAAIPIRYMAFVPLFAGLREISTIALWAAGDRRTPIIGLTIAVCGSIALNYLFIGIPGFGYAGAAIGFLFLELVSALWNLRAVNRLLKSVISS